MLKNAGPPKEYFIMRKPETVFELSIDGPLDLKRNIGETECLIFYQDSTGQLVARSAVSLDTAAFLWQKFLAFK